MSAAAPGANGAVPAPEALRTSGPGARLAAVDLGATSGRVILGAVEGGRLRMRHIARFSNDPVRLTEDGGVGLHWNITALYQSVEDGLCTAAAEAGGLDSIGIDSWAVDYALLRTGRMLGVPYHYRDERTARGVELVRERLTAAELFSASGLQHLDFNTVFQLALEAEGGWLELADRLLLIPDLLGYWLTGQARAEATNASTTGLLGVRSGTWDAALLERLGYPRALLPDLIAPGERLGTLTTAVGERIGAPGTPVTAVGSHDTASAVVAVPMESRSAAYISSGTWSLVGLELDEPVLSTAAQEANFTNEGGVDGRVRFLKNVSGLWLLSESMRTWERGSSGSERASDLAELLAAAEAVERPVPVFDAGDEVFVAPGDMPARIAQWCSQRGIEPPRTRPEVVRSILESLAAAYAQTIEQAEALAGRRADVIHIVGGGSQNAPLCRLTAQRTGRTVIAGPVEATAMGNLLVQARAVGAIDPAASLEDLREIVRASAPVQRY
ncbi:rhamnulokinase [Brevibacterium sp. 5221]|uniref:Rhamnulokinase n=1 Tax=Brevibacterium rongguiense TaxID=2695267 RepID=A0A6N9H5J4_9MICO|nr:rhamnulokinase family protein [Brevibacterium rongguiense]MYM19111.1 rhamnulokinase [Brevibacterium rongguiense]